MAKLDFASFIGVGAVSYALIVVMVQCHSYYKHYKETVYVENDSDTHPNWYNFGDAFHKDLIFFRGVTIYYLHMLVKVECFLFMKDLKSRMKMVIKVLKK